MICNKCGKEILPSASFCHNCGEQIDISSQTKKKKAPDPSFGAKPVVNSCVKAEEKVVLTAKPEPPEKTPVEIPEEEKTAPKIEEVVKILKADITEEEEEAVFAAIEPIEPSLPPKKKKSKKGIILAIVFAFVAAVMIFSALMLILPDSKPFSNIREALGIAQTSTDSPVSATAAPSATISETEKESLQPDDGSLLNKPAAPDIANAEKIHISAVVYSENSSLRVSFSVDFSNDGETVFFIPADEKAQTADMIYVLSDNGTYDSYEGGYGQFFAVETDKEYDINNSDIPDNLALPLALLGESFRSDYDGKYKAAGSETLEGTGDAYVYGISSQGETETVWVDADTGIFVKRRNNEGDVFVASVAEINGDIEIPDFRNNIIEE